MSSCTGASQHLSPKEPSYVRVYRAWSLEDYKLGTILGGGLPMVPLHALVKGSHSPHPVPEIEISKRVEKDVETDIFRNTDDEAKNVRNLHSIGELETTSFLPTSAYIEKCLQIPEVNNYMEEKDRRYPVFLLIGVKVARDIKALQRGVRGLKLSPGTGKLTEAEEKLWKIFRGKPNEFLSTLFVDPDMTVVGIRLLQLSYTRPHIFGSRTEVEVNELTRGRTLYDNA